MPENLDPERWLLLVRHASVTIDPTHAAHTWPLSANGRSQAHQFAHHLAQHLPAPVSHVLTSTEAKAAETGQILADTWGCGWETAVNLHEHSRHQVPYLGQAEFDTAVAHFFAHPDDLVLGEETAQQATDRFSYALQAIITTHPQQKLAIVSHGTVLTLWLCRHNPHLHPFPLWHSLTLPWAVLVSLPDGQVVKKFNFS